jgi:octopine/nopaline transport system permease protein
VTLSYFELIGFGPSGWGGPLLAAAAMTVMVAVVGFLVGSIVGTLVAWARISGPRPCRVAAQVYTTVLRGIPDLLVIYLFYFGGSIALTALARYFGATGFVAVPAFISGALAIGIVSSSYQAEVFRGAYLALNRGEIEAATSVGMSTWLMFRRIVGPQVLRFALPSLANLWQTAIKESALVSVTGLMELLHLSAIAAGATYRPFDFYITAALLYLLIAGTTGSLFTKAESHLRRGTGQRV